MKAKAIFFFLVIFLAVGTVNPSYAGGGDNKPKTCKQKHKANKKRLKNAAKAFQAKYHKKPKSRG